jgi:predicted ABC-type exoprotein transport system permease subunit
MLAQPQTFPCPNCGEIINDSMQTCRFCSAAVDPEAASAAAELQTRVNRACSDASFLRTAAAAMFVLLALSIVPFISLITYLGFIITFLVVLVLLVRWQIKFGRLQTKDTDYNRAKSMRTVALVLWLVAIPLFVVRDILVAIIARAFV